uniref:KIB1-4 beta-propeller domain-containing protein n=1 Tax=Ananas comosus var. bracteatus TaxID=296719 RepID=A0A6V7PZ27_ANACO|nr:unnamed protein product [Ananas comosus var. bracteatus]
MANYEDRRPHSEEEEEKAAAATTGDDDDAKVTRRKAMITASIARRHLLVDVLHNTCSAWRSAATAVTDYPHLQRKNSLLALSADPEGDFRRLISPSLNLQLSDSSYHFRCCGLFDDWIAAVTASGRVFLLRQVPVTARVELPPISTLTLPPGFGDADNWQRNPLYVKKIALSAPPDSPDCLAVAMYWFNHLAVCRPGDAEWTAVHEPWELNRVYFDYYYKDAIFVAPRELIAVALTGRVVSFEFSSLSGSRRPPVVTVLMPDMQHWRSYSRAFLANCDGEAVLVERSSAFGFEVLKLVEDDRGRWARKWEKQEGLQGKKAMAAVVSRCGCVCVPVEEAPPPGLEENCIYFAEARKDKGEPLRAGVFRMSDKSIRWVGKILECNGYISDVA